MIKKIQTLYINLVILFSILLLPSCTAQEEILPGLCFSDGYGSYTCIEKDQKQEDERDMEELEPLYEACEEWELHSGETWMQCIMNEERRRQLLERVKHTA